MLCRSAKQGVKELAAAGFLEARPEAVARFIREHETLLDKAQVRIQGVTESCARCHPCPTEMNALPASQGLEAPPYWSSHGVQVRRPQVPKRL